MFIVLEGLDGAGTTTLCRRLSAWIEEHAQAVVQTFEPTDLPIGQLIRATLRQEADAPGRASLPWMFAADRSDHLARRIEPALREKQHVVCDRYMPSSLAYQALEVGMDRVWALNEGFRVPDLLVFLDIDVDTALTRISRRGGSLEVYERREHLERIARNYQEALSRLRDRGDRVVVIDGTLPIDEVSRAIRGLVEPLVA